MANTLITPDMVSKEALRILSNNLPFCKSINRVYESEFAQEGNKIGDTFDIRVPNQFDVTKSRAIDVQDIAEKTTPLTIDKEYHVAFEITSKDMALDIDMFSNRLIKPAVVKLANQVEFDVLDDAYKYTYNHVGSVGNEMDSFRHAVVAGSRLTNELAPREGRFILASPEDTAGVTATTQANFHQAAEVSKQFLDGYIGRMAGFDWLESAIMPSHANGTRTGTGADVNTTAGQGITSGDATISMTSLTANQTVKVGDIFTIAGVYAANFQSKARQPYLQQFVIQNDETLVASDTVEVLPVPILTGPRKNIEIVGAGAGKTVTWLGAASAVWRQNLAYHRDAFTLAMPPKQVPDGSAWSSMASEDGFGVRVIKEYDIRNDTDVCRIDVMFGFDKLYNEHCVRVSGT